MCKNEQLYKKFFISTPDTMTRGGEKSMRKKVMLFSLCLFTTAVFFQGLSYFFFLNITDSLPLGLYLRIPGGDYQKGDYIVYEPSEDVRRMVADYGWGDGNHVFLKQIGAVSGEHYAVHGEPPEFTIEGTVRGRVFDSDTQGHPLPKLRGEFIVPEGHVLPVATNPRSFDGRYTGTIPVGCIKAKVIPLWTP